MKLRLLELVEGTTFIGFVEMKFNSSHANAGFLVLVAVVVSGFNGADFSLWSFGATLSFPGNWVTGYEACCCKLEVVELTILVIVHACIRDGGLELRVLALDGIEEVACPGCL